MKVFFLGCFLMFLPVMVHAHAGPHGNDECIVNIGDTELRLSGYQFKGSNPDRHYCHHFPYLGQTIIKLDSVTADLNNMAVELQLLKRQSWLGLILNADDAFSVIKQQEVQYFSKQVVSIDADIQERDVYALRLILHDANGKQIHQQFVFLVGFPFAQIMVAIAVLLLFILGFVVFKQAGSKRQ